MDSGKYANDPEWASITPIPLDDGSESGAMPLATIAYPSDYLEATSYLRAVMAANEMSERALKLTKDVISMNPAHYTVWIYRAKILFALDKDLFEELEWLNGVSLKYLKNYQIWSVSQAPPPSPHGFKCTLPHPPPKELDFLMEMLAEDSKNYHVWTYRHWLVRHFALWDTPREVEDINSLIKLDVRNNSAWNHRYMLKFGPRQDAPDAGMANAGNAAFSTGETGVLPVIDEDLVDDAYHQGAGESESVVVCAGVFRAAGRDLREWEEFAGKFVVSPDEVKSSHAIEWLADVYSQDGEKGARAVEMLTLLGEKYDPIRKNYWDYRIQQIAV
ncbi:Protein farnesyltransferase/geranylgeranyltransferase type-1 subunit alpha [Penicillium argentinense]|uniref:Protein farnesyltransferase/geranylgeranyltransferase type-1 subunit alpha n=1 Tax=Penicillium argentinense TaxID=1131581 RepID=A0A9W9EZ90_9EURO|nr:Protein farnesyltransferase/geranylgeranyltransferase type-1 subunit alpha [Penicillium argentinense]KAJ5090728.1 Protein farnesyltransferase/geranylgeranyltransferase type-1 subunit alpha [Penicillium argentinense]